MPTCDLVIPTYNDAHVLPRTLRAIAASKLPAQWQVRCLISDDGSTDNTAAVCEAVAAQTRLVVRYLPGPHVGIARARNRALRHITGELVLLLGADIVLHPRALAQHFRFHEQNPSPQAAALGMVLWDPRLKPSPFMEWMMHGGQQNEYDTLLGHTVADPAHFFYGSHVSLKRTTLQGKEFLSVFTQYGWEDQEFGRRLAAEGVVLHVVEQALGWHHHYYPVRDIIRRQEISGVTLVEYQAVHPHIPLVPHRSSRQRVFHKLFLYSGAYALLRQVVQWTGKKWSTPRLFLWVTAAAQWRGIYEGQRTNPSAS